MHNAHTEIHTYPTSGDGISRLLYSAETLVKLTFQNQGDGGAANGVVDIGTREDLGVPGSGQGFSLPLNDQVSFVIGKQDRIFIASSGFNLVAFITEPIAFTPQILAEIEKIHQQTENSNKRQQELLMAQTKLLAKMAGVPVGNVK